MMKWFISRGIARDNIYYVIRISAVVLYLPIWNKNEVEVII